MEGTQGLLAIFTIATCFLVNGAQKTVCKEEAVADIVFLVDGSWSIGSENFKQIRQFLYTLVNSFDVSPDHVRIGLVQYSNTPRTEFLLNTFQDKQDILQYINNLRYMGGETNTGLGLDFLLNELFVDRAGSRVNENVPQIAVVITDGESMDNVGLHALKLKKQGVTLYAIGIKEADEDQLKEIATTPHNQHVYSVSDFAALQGISQSLIQVLCTTVDEAKRPISKVVQECLNATVADIVFLVDGSTSISPTNFQEVRKFLHSFIEGLDIGADKVRVGLAQFSNEIQKQFHLGEHTDQRALLEQVDRLPQLGGGTATGKAITVLREEFFTKANGSRADQRVPQIAVVLTDGESADDVELPAKALRKQGVIVFAIGVGAANINELKDIANRPHKHFLVNIESFQALQTLSQGLLQTVCVSMESQRMALIPKFSDIFFLVDSNMMQADFQLVRTLLMRLVNQLNPCTKTMRLGLAQFAQDTKVEFLLNTHNTKEEYLAALRKFRLPLRPNRSRHLGDALEYARAHFFTTASGGRNEQGYRQFLVTVTGGDSKDNVMKVARTIKSEGTTIVSIGLGESTLPELKLMATSPFFYQTTPIASVLKTVFETEEVVTVTDDCSEASLADIVFIVDVSSSYRTANFQLVRGFIHKIVDGLDMDFNRVRVGIVLYSNKASAQVYLNSFQDKTNILQFIKILPYRRGLTYTGEALEYAREKMFIKERGSRKEQGVQQVAIVITGKSQDNVTSHAAALRRAGVTVYAVGIKDADENELRQIASDPPNKHVLHVDSFAKLKTLEKSLKSVCYNILKKAVKDNARTYTAKQSCLQTDEADMFFLIDHSGSIEYPDFADMKTFIKEFIDTFHIGPHHVRVGVVKFSDTPALEFDLTTYPDKPSVEKAVDGIIQLGGGTSTGLALTSMGPYFDRAKATRSNKVREYLIVITDGESQDNVKDQAAKLRAQGIIIYAIGVNLANDTQLLEIAGSQEKKFFVNNFDALKPIKNDIITDICSPDICKDMKGDVLFLIDSSGSINNPDFQKMKVFMQSIINKSDIGLDKVHVGIIQFSTSQQVIFPLNKHNDKEGMLHDLQMMQQIGGGTLTGEALSYTSQFFDPPKGGRTNVKQFLIVVTDGEAQDEVTSPAKKLQDKGVIIYTIGVVNANNTQLLEISGAQERVYSERDFDALKALDSQLALAICDPESHFQDSGEIKDNIDDKDMNRFQVLTTVHVCVEGDRLEKRSNMEGTQGLLAIFTIATCFLVNGAQKTVCKEEAVADIVFLVDGSWSIGSENFKQIRQFLYTLVNSFDVSPDHVRIGLVQYSNTPRTEFLLNTFQDKQDILQYINNLRYMGGETNTGLGLDFLLNELFVDRAGSRVNENVPQIAVVITDGESMDNVGLHALKLKKQGVTLYAIGIKEADEDQLKEIATTPHNQHVYSVSDFAALQGISQSLIQVLCTTVDEAKRPISKVVQECLNATVADIVFLVDGSTSISPTNFQEVRKFLHSFIEGLDIGADKVRVGLAQFSNEIQKQFHLGEHTDQRALLEQVDRLPQLGGGTATGKAITVLREEFFTKANGSRADQRVPQIAVVLTDGESADDVELPAKALRKQGVIVFAIGVGAANINELKDIANRPHKHFLVNIESFQALQTLSQGLLQTVCVSMESQRMALIPKFSDIFFLVDSNMMQADFQLVRTLLMRLVNQLNPCTKTMRLGLAQFAQDTKVEFLLNTHNTKEEYLAALRKFRLPLRPNRSRHLGDALEYARAHFFTTASGGRNEQGYRQFLVTVTGGDSKDNVMKVARTIKSEGTTIVSIGLGESTLPELKLMATSPFFYQTTPIASVLKTVFETEEVVTVTDDCSEASLADIVFIVDVSSSYRTANFQLVRGFIHKIVDGLDMDFNRVRVGIVLYSNKASAQVYLNSFQDKTNILQFIKILPYRRGLTYTGEALEYAREKMFIKERGSRKEQGVQQVAIVITGKSQDNVTSHAAALRRAGVTVYAVGIKDADENELRQIASDPPNKHVLHVDSFAKLKTLEKSLKSVCYNILKKAVKDNARTYTAKQSCLQTDEADMFFLIDHSGSIEYPDFADMKTFIKEFIDTFHIGPHHVRVGVVKFSDTPALEFDLTTYPDKPSVEKAVDGIIQLGGGTSTGLALTSMGPYFDRAKATRSNKVREYLIVITDGESQDNVKDQAAKLRAQGIIIYAIGVNLANDTQLLEIAGSQEKKFFVNNFDALKPIKNDIITDICSPDICKDMKGDVLFLIDSSGSINNPDFQKMKVFMQSIINKSDIGLDKVHVGIIQFSTSQQVIFPLNKHNDKEGMLHDLQMMQQIGGGTLTGEALSYTSQFFDPPKGGRTNVKQFLIVVTDGEAQDEVTSPAKKLQDKGVIIYTIGVVNANNTQLLEISGAQERVYSERDFDALKALDSQLALAICDPE
ncbi:collagen alpha-3(VI) chain-like [Salvelinus alpinus]